MPAAEEMGHRSLWAGTLRIGRAVGIATRPGVSLTLPEAPLLDGEFVLRREDFYTIATCLQADTGIALSEAKAMLLYSRLAQRLRELGLTCFGQYCDVLAGPAGGQERRVLLTALTTNVTSFFREPHHFADLQAHVLPRLLSRAAQGARVRIWSAACSTGQEPYSIALTILAAMPRAASFDLQIIATDIDPAVLKTASEGGYSERDLANLTPAQRRYFEDHGTSWFVGEELRRLVTFRELNLAAPIWPARGPFDVIMCRNVLIYFNEQTQSDVLRRLSAALNDDGTLYVGHSESLSGPAAALLQRDGVTTYRRPASLVQRRAAAQPLHRC